MKSIKYLVGIYLLLGFYFQAFGQADFPKDFAEQMKQMDLVIASPVERSYRKKRIKKSDIFSPAYVIKSRRERVEIQYALLPQANSMALIPQVNASTTLTSLASNEDDQAIIALHDINSEELSETFNADWGCIAYFQPKRSFSRFRYGKLLSLYKAGRGMVHVLFLFDRGGEEEVERRFFAAWFENEELGNEELGNEE